MFKNCCGRLAFTNTCTDQTGTAKFILESWMKVETDAKTGLVHYPILRREVKHRVWHSFWDSMLLQELGEEYAKRLVELKFQVSMSGKAQMRE